MNIEKLKQYSRNKTPLPMRRDIRADEIQNSEEIFEEVKHGEVCYEYYLDVVFCADEIFGIGVCGEDNDRQGKARSNHHRHGHPAGFAAEE